MLFFGTDPNRFARALLSQMHMMWSNDYRTVKQIWEYKLNTTGMNVLTVQYSWEIFVLRMWCLLFSLVNLCVCILLGPEAHFLLRLDNELILFYSILFWCPIMMISVLFFVEWKCKFCWKISYSNISPKIITKQVCFHLHHAALIILRSVFISYSCEEAICACWHGRPNLW